MWMRVFMVVFMNGLLFSSDLNKELYEQTNE